ncbi:hypothetical protein [Methyloceanibacter superfactus]|nr:hypothetical protein [Methyloceanibacter superfactus]
MRRVEQREMTPLSSAYGFATIVTLALVNHPWLLDQFAEEVASVEVQDSRSRPCSATSPEPSSTIPPSTGPISSTNC